MAPSLTRRLSSLAALLLAAPTTLCHPSRNNNIEPRQDEGSNQPNVGPNPINPGWYADPDGIKADGNYWIYATLSINFDDQQTFDALSAPTIAGPWTKHPAVFDPLNGGSKWATKWLWAPCTIERGGKWYFYYTANNPIEFEDTAGIGVAAADSPGGPFVDVIDKPLIGKRWNGANAMDQQVFHDRETDKWYLIWGGSFARIAPLGDDMASIVAWEDGTTDPKDITPNEGFGEGSYMFQREGWYYFMWSEGGYGTPDYRVAYAKSQSVLGPFERIGLILDKGDSSVSDGPGHHSIIRETGEDGVTEVYYIVYHRRILGDTVADHRVLAVDKLFFAEDGAIEKVVMT